MMPKVELHVHLEGSIRPETVLKLAHRHGVDLPANTVEGLQDWYTFRDFPHFVEVYVAVSKCIKTPDDLELVTREFLQGQANQNVKHTEITYTASTIEKYAGIPWKEQIVALSAARDWASQNLGVSSGFIIDIVRGDSPDRAIEVAKWALDGRERGVCALGISGEERLGTKQYKEAFDLVHAEGLPIAAHAGETVGPQSVLDTLDTARPNRIGHGVRVLEDPMLTRRLVRDQIPLEVCPTSNVCLGVFPDLASHPLPRLLDEGIYVTLNSDDPPMFNTTISDEYYRCASLFELDENIVWTLMLNAARAAFLPDEEKQALVQNLRAEFNELLDEE